MEEDIRVDMSSQHPIPAPMPLSQFLQPSRSRNNHLVTTIQQNLICNGFRKDAFNNIFNFFDFICLSSEEVMQMAHRSNWDWRQIVVFHLDWIFKHIHSDA